MAGHHNQSKLNSNLRETASEGSAPMRDGFWQWTGFGDKTLWNFLELLILPVSLIVGVWYLNSQTSQQQQQSIASQSVEQQQVAEMAVEQTQQETLDRYIEEVVTSIEGGLLTSNANAQQRDIARARTLLTLRSLDPERKALLVQFIYESGLISTTNTIVPLNRADLNGLDLRTAYLPQANLQETLLANTEFVGATLEGVDLSISDLNGAGLGDAFLFQANLSRAELKSADLSQAILVRANLSGANLEGATLDGAFLVRTNLRGANLRNATLSGTNLNEANLSAANLEGVDLSQAYLCKTTMPDGVIENRDCP